MCAPTGLAGRRRDARLTTAMNIARWSVSLVAIIGVMAATVAGATIWLLLSDPVKGADAAGAMFKGDPGPFMQAIGAVIYDALKGLFKYL